MIEPDDLLRSYRASGPPSDLRARIVQRVARPRRIEWAWVPAFATAALIVLFHVLGLSVREGIAARLDVPGDLKPVEQWLAPGQEVP